MWTDYFMNVHMIKKTQTSPPTERTLKYERRRRHFDRNKEI